MKIYNSLNSPQIIGSSNFVKSSEYFNLERENKELKEKLKAVSRYSKQADKIKNRYRKLIPVLKKNKTSFNSNDWSVVLELFNFKQDF